MLSMAYVDDLIDSILGAERCAYAKPSPPVSQTKQEPQVNAVRVNQSGLRIGECHQRARFSDAQVEEMRRMHEDDGATYKEIAMMFKTNIYVVGKICRYESRNQYADRVKIVRVE